MYIAAIYPAAHVNAKNVAYRPERMARFLLSKRSQQRGFVLDSPDPFCTLSFARRDTRL